MQIFVSGRSTKVIRIHADDGVDVLKSKVEQYFGIPTHHQQLHFAGKPLQVGSTIMDNFMREGSTVFLSMRLRGGRGELETTNGEGDCVDFLETTRDLPPTLEREGSHGTENLHAICIPESEEADSEADAHDPQNTSAEGIEQFLNDRSKSPHHNLAENLEKGDNILSTIELSRTSSPENDPEEPHGNSPENFEQQGQSSVSASTPSKPILGLAGVKRNLSMEMSSPPAMTYNMPLAPLQAPFPVPFPFPGHGGHFSMAMTPQRQMPHFFPVSLPHPSLVHKRPKGLAYDLDLVDDKLKKRLLKNRQSAERSRQKKNAMMKGLEGQLDDSQTECEQLRTLAKDLDTKNQSLEEENQTLRALLKANGIAVPGQSTLH
mmetsp:Transcript_9871/g.19729  ORF Transcript_9871/g.19729 Transcript_9871/m.19729 type:complete len:376 (-) Transcript_9871:86-1213(-)